MNLLNLKYLLLLISIGITNVCFGFQTYPNSSTYEYDKGVSFACPQVTGVAALLWEQYPQKTNVEIKDAILSSVEFNADLYSKVKSSGVLNLNNALIQIQDDCRLRDSLALVSFYHSLNGPNWSRFQWDFSQPMSSWSGVRLHPEGCVKSIVFSQSKNINGQIPPEIGNLKDLEQLYLYNQGGISGNFTEEIYALTNLKDLTLYKTNINGSLSSAIANMSSLEILRIEQSKMTGTLPVELGELKNLRNLNLQNSSHEGTIPGSIGDLPLSILKLANNNFSGCFDINLQNICGANVNIYSGNNFDAPWTDFCSSYAGCCEGSCPSSIVLDDYNLCETATIWGTEVIQTSGIAYSKYNDHLYVVNSKFDPRLYEMHKDGTIIRDFDLELPYFNDLESVVVIDENTIAIATEDQSGNLIFVDLPPDHIKKGLIEFPGYDKVIHFPQMMDNGGIEGATYDQENKILYIGKEKDTPLGKMGVYTLENPLDYLGTDVTFPNVTIDIQEEYVETGQVRSFGDLTGLSMTNTGTLLAVAENGNRFIEINPLTLELFGFFDTGIFGTKLSGVTVDLDDNLYIADHHSEQAWYTYKKECDTRPICTTPMYTLPYLEDFSESNNFFFKNSFGVEIEDLTFLWSRHIDSLGYEIGNGKEDEFFVNPNRKKNYNEYASFIIPCIQVDSSLSNPFLMFDRLIPDISSVLNIHVNTIEQSAWTLIYSESEQPISDWTSTDSISLNDYSGSLINIRVTASKMNRRWKQDFVTYQYSATFENKVLIDNILISADGLVIPPSSEECLDSLYLTGTEDLFNYEASESIDSEQLIDGESVIYEAGEIISLEIGFEVTVGTTFYADIEGCN